MTSLVVGVITATIAACSPACLPAALCNIMVSYAFCGKALCSIAAKAQAELAVSKGKHSKSGNVYIHHSCLQFHMQLPHVK